MSKDKTAMSIIFNGEMMKMLDESRKILGISRSAMLAVAMQQYFIQQKGVELTLDPNFREILEKENRSSYLI